MHVWMYVVWIECVICGGPCAQATIPLCTLVQHNHTLKCIIAFVHPLFNPRVNTIASTNTRTGITTHLCHNEQVRSTSHLHIRFTILIDSDDIHINLIPVTSVIMHNIMRKANFTPKYSEDIRWEICVKEEFYYVEQIHHSTFNSMFEMIMQTVVVMRTQYMLKCT